MFAIMKTLKEQKNMWKKLMKKNDSPHMLAIYERNYKILQKILSNIQTMSPKEFDSYPDRYKWQIMNELGNGKWIPAWKCKHCGCDQDTPQGTLGERYCSTCEGELTHRTGGGQNDPFNWTYKKKRKINEK